MKKINRSKYTFIKLSIVGLVFVNSCKTNKPTGEFLSKNEFLTVNLLKNQKFEYLYYKSDDVDISYDYIKGTYSANNNTFTLYPDTLKDKEFEYALHADNDSSIGLTRIKLETNIYGDFLNKYKIYLHSKSAKLVFNGTSIDTIINTSNFHKFYIEILLAEEYLSGTPIPKYKNILTKEITLDTNFNFFTITVPISRQTFYYKNSPPLLIEDLGTYWMLINNKKKILKGKIFPK
jgi:hypothetical protein